MELKEILELSALLLALVNGLFLLWYRLRDKAKLAVHPIHPDIYQWWFRLPDGESEGKPTRKYGFLSYVGITNKGLRKVSLTSWRLYISTVSLKKVELKPKNLTEIKIKLGDADYVKFIPVLGQKDLIFEGDTIIDSGVSISGMTYYVIEFYGSEEFNPKIKDGKIIGKFIVQDVFGKKARTKIKFSETPLEKIKTMVKDIDKIP